MYILMMWIKFLKKIWFIIGKTPIVWAYRNHHYDTSLIIVTRTEKFSTKHRGTIIFGCECDIWYDNILSGASMQCRVLFELIIEYSNKKNIKYPLPSSLHSPTALAVTSKNDSKNTIGPTTALVWENENIWHTYPSRYHIIITIH